MNPTEPSLVDGSALQALRLQHGLQPSHVARLTGLRLRQVQALEAQRLESFRNRDHMVQCALLVATRLSGGAAQRPAQSECVSRFQIPTGDGRAPPHAAAQAGLFPRS